MRFEDDVSLVTGGASGIGRATARRLAAEGSTTIVTDVDVENGRETVEQIREDGGTATFRELDVRDHDTFEATVDGVADEHGSIDVLFNNAGITQASNPIPEVPLEERDRVIDVNIRGVWNGIRAAVPAMRATGGGAIVNTASMAAIHGGVVQNDAAYTMTKAAVLNLTKAAAVDTGHHGIRVNAVCPGPIETPMLEAAFEKADDPAEAREAWESETVVGRLGDPAEIAACVAFLASDDASFVTGLGLLADGGMSIV